MSKKRGSKSKKPVKGKKTVLERVGDAAMDGAILAGTGVVVGYGWEVFSQMFQRGMKAAK